MFGPCGRRIWSGVFAILHAALPQGQQSSPECECHPCVRRVRWRHEQPSSSLLLLLLLLLLGIGGRVITSIELTGGQSR